MMAPAVVELPLPVEVEGPEGRRTWPMEVLVGMAKVRAVLLEEGEEVLLLLIV